MGGIKVFLVVIVFLQLLICGLIVFTHVDAALSYHPSGIAAYASTWNQDREEEIAKSVQDKLAEFPLPERRR